jgi:hypothetical protein
VKFNKDLSRYCYCYFLISKKKVKVGLWDDHAVCLSVNLYPPPPNQLVNAWNVRISCNLSPSQRRTSWISPINMCVCIRTPLSLLGNGSLKMVPRNTHATTELLDASFSMRSVPCIKGTTFFLCGLFTDSLLQHGEQEERCRYSGWLRAGWPRGTSSRSDRVKNVLFFTSSRPALGPTPASYPMGTGGFSRRVKWPGREADHSHPTSEEVKKMWNYTSTPPYALMV